MTSDFYILVMEEIFPSIRNRYNLTEQPQTFTGIHPDAQDAMTEPPTIEEEQQYRNFLNSL